MSVELISMQWIAVATYFDCIERIACCTNHHILSVSIVTTTTAYRSQKRPVLIPLNNSIKNEPILIIFVRRILTKSVMTGCKVDIQNVLSDRKSTTDSNYMLSRLPICPQHLTNVAALTCVLQKQFSLSLLQGHCNKKVLIQCCELTQLCTNKGILQYCSEIITFIQR